MGGGGGWIGGGPKAVVGRMDVVSSSRVFMVRERVVRVEAKIPWWLKVACGHHVSYV
jgi:hypothetical protein